ncbi:hypothetical protein ACRZTK_004163 [Enterobacter asburiae]
MNIDEISLVSGGNANGNYEAGGSRSSNSGAHNSRALNPVAHIYSDQAQLSVVMLSLVGWSEWQEEPLVEQLSANVCPVVEMATKVETKPVPVIGQEVTSVVLVADKKVSTEDAAMVIKILSFILSLLLGFALLSGSSIIDLSWFSLPEEFSKIVITLITLFSTAKFTDLILAKIKKFIK